MQLASPTPREALKPNRAKAQPTEAASPEAIAEINAYIAIRDELFSEAEELRTKAKLDSASAANDFVAQYVKPARSPYQAQALPEQDAVRERTRCEFVTRRIAQLRMLVAPLTQMCRA